MITHNLTYYDNYNIKTFSEYHEGVLVFYEEYNKDGLRVFSTDIDGEIKKYEYDYKKRIKRYFLKDKVGNISWKKYSYSKENLIILHRREGTPPQIHKMIFGPEDTKGERQLIKDLFL